MFCVDAAVVGGRAVDRSAAGRRAARDVVRRRVRRATAWTSCDVSAGVVDRLEARVRDVVDLRVQPLDRDVEVAVERELDRVVERQSTTGVGRAVAGRLCAGVPVAASASGLSAVREGRRSADQLLNAARSSAVRADRRRARADNAASVAARSTPAWIASCSCSFLR